MSIRGAKSQIWQQIGNIGKCLIQRIGQKAVIAEARQFTDRLTGHFWNPRTATD